MKRVCTVHQNDTELTLFVSSNATAEICIECLDMYHGLKLQLSQTHFELTCKNFANTINILGILLIVTEYEYTNKQSHFFVLSISANKSNTFI